MLRQGIGESSPTDPDIPGGASLERDELRWAMSGGLVESFQGDTQLGTQETFLQ
jgi:hypothetical protein